MKKAIKAILPAAITLLSLTAYGSAHAHTRMAGTDVSALSVVADSVAYTESETQTEQRESIFPQKSLSLALSHFTWGADIGGSIDLDSNDMSTFDADVNFGYKNKYIRIIGVGAGIHRAFGNGNTFIPIYFLFRSSFRSRPSLCFFNLRAGYSFNTIRESPMFGDISASIGIGFNLAMSRRFMSHIILSYGFRHFSRRHRTEAGLPAENSNLAQISFGVNF